MKAISFATASLILSIAAATASAAAPPMEGLVPSRATNFDEAFLRSGADFRPYRKVLLKPAEMSFDRHWLRDIGRHGATVLGRVTAQETSAFLASSRAAFDASWAHAFRSAGYQVVVTPGEGVLELAPQVRDLYLNAPGSLATGVSKSYVREVGRATLHLVARDSRTGATLGQFRDARSTNDGPLFRLVDPGTNAREFGRLFTAWADIAASGLGRLAAQSPLP